MDESSSHLSNRDAVHGGIRFLIVSAVRTGSNLLLGYLNSHPDCFAGGELFRDVCIEKEDWLAPTRPEALQRFEELAELRQRDPIQFVDYVFAVKTYRAIGYKLIYYDAEKNEDITAYLAGIDDIRVIHLKRKNLLRRLLSMRRGEKTGIWHMSRSAPDDPQRPRQMLSLMECAWDFNYIEAMESKYDALFAKHNMIEVFYEDLAAKPSLALARVLGFLDLPQREDLSCYTKKLGTDTLRDAIENYDELKSRFSRWASYFEE
jgi:LPS sulfotransferase NodH